MTDTNFKYEVGSHTWPATQLLAGFISVNRGLFKGKTVLELGSGATGVAGIACGMAKAKRVIMTDKENEEMSTMLRENIEKNGVEDVCTVETLDWSSPSSLSSLLSRLEEGVDWIVASDVFFDLSVFKPLMEVIETLLKRFPKAQLMFSYENRCAGWSIEGELEGRGLGASLIRKEEVEGHSLQLGMIYLKGEEKIVAGIEGGGSFSSVVFVSTLDGKERGRSTNEGSNQYLNGAMKTADGLAKWMREAKQEAGLVGPLEAWGLGLSGAEDEKINEEMIDYLLSQHGDIAKKIVLKSDSEAAIAAVFQNGGAVIISGTGSTTRLMTREGQLKGVGGWGHVIGDEGSAFWIARRGMQVIFEVEDGTMKRDIGRLKKVILGHFSMDDKIELLDLLYSKFDKARVASVTKELAENADDPTIAELFKCAGGELGRHMSTLMGKIPEGDTEMLSNLRVLAVGSVFKSWKLMREGFIEGLEMKEGRVEKMTMYRLKVDASMGAAVLAARAADTIIPLIELKEEDVLEIIKK